LADLDEFADAAQVEGLFAEGIGAAVAAAGQANRSKRKLCNFMGILIA
jgi:hypothetical protein